MKVTVIGGGNVGTLMAAEIAYRGHEVTLYTSKPKLWNKEIRVYNAKEACIRTGVMASVTDSIKEALKAAEYVFVTVPAQLFSELAEKMLPFVQRGQHIGIVPGSGGAEFAFRALVDEGCILFGFGRVHSIARLKEYGHSVYELGRKKSLRIGAVPAGQAEKVAKRVECFFDMPCESVDNYLSVTLTPSNSILHTARLYTMFRDYRPGGAYPRNFLFYEEWSDASSELLIACDRELQKLCGVIPMELGSVVSLCDYYESHTVSAMTEKIRSIQAFKGLPSPMSEAAGGWIPDWDSRYFTADFSFGLKVIKDIAGLFAVPTPHIDLVWNWYRDTAPDGRRNIFEPDVTVEQFLNLY